MPKLPRRAVAAGVVFAIVPCVSCGMATPVVFGIATLFLTGLSRRAFLTLLASTLVYSAALAVYLNLYESDDGGTADFLASVAWAILAFGALQAFATSFWVAGKVAGPAAEPGAQEVIADVTEDERMAVEVDPELRSALHRRERRKLAREIVIKDPALAVDLCIGRPDLDRRFVDGGLIDVNNVPAWVLGALPGFDQAMAQRVLDARARFEGLQSAADLVVHADIPSEVIEDLEERLLFAPLAE